jgi:hypothetical protein
MKQSFIKQLSNMTVSDIVTQYPEAQEIFEHYGIPAQGVAAQQWEWITATCRVHQLNCDKVLSDLAQALA